MHQAPYGSWPSPIDAALVAARSGAPEYLGAVGDELWWTVPRPDEGGRRALMRLAPDAGGAVSVLPAPWNVRSRVHEYGGQPWAGLARDGGGPLIVFADFADQRLHAAEPDTAEGPGAAQPRPLTPLSSVGGGLRWCDPVLRDGEVWCVLEEFTGERPGELRRLLAAVPLDGTAADDRSAIRELTDDRHRFVTGPRISPDGTRAAWLAWDHPRMPWDGTELVIADITAAPGGRHELTGARTLIGGPGESVAQVEWAADGTLLAATDRTGWWNLHRVDPDTGDAVGLCPRDEEFADALWRVGTRWFAPLDDGRVAVLHGVGARRLGVLDPATGELADAAGPWAEWSGPLAVRGSRVAAIAGGPDRGREIVCLDTVTGRCRAVAEEHEHAVDPAYYPEPVARTVTGPGGREVHAYVYPPRHPEFTGPDGAAPPLVVRAHGGPTGRAAMLLDLEIAHLTSRGFAVADVNYGGSTGYGRAYRERLAGQWGVVDVEDCAAVARALVEESAADPDRIAISGGSAGGWTAAASLASPATAGLYACAALTYPVIDLATWDENGTHDFEARYLDGLIGPRDEAADLYRERSPAARADLISVPFVLLQGLDDPICPPAQAEALLAAVVGRGVPHAYLTFPGEGHGFRRAETIRRAIEAELGLYLTVFGIERPDAPALDLGGLATGAPGGAGERG
ncbi:LpqB family beta-propeller domain-containing protein [Streptomyces sp. PT12]|uniref:S9 family peptidase n=1 Tax=Streptomyces sp. PT12 TaxID=1510197 RepID=UPI000DE2AAD9|nr:LpqB family beta-propeller domain-containing protein [Streptomyces sp. PT12]RBM20841.1 acyl-peptide hydrolase [Streptomyces sp. PT12]